MYCCLQGQPVWSREGDVTSISADKGSEELAVGLSDGSVILLDSFTWKEREVLKVSPVRQPIKFVKYGRIKESKLPKPFLMVRTWGYEHMVEPLYCGLVEAERILQNPE